MHAPDNILFGSVSLTITKAHVILKTIPISSFREKKGQRNRQTSIENYYIDSCHQFIGMDSGVSEK